MKIIQKESLASISGTTITSYGIHAPRIAEKALPGQFVVVMVCEEGERLPLTIVDTDRKAGIIRLIAQELGFSTKLMGTLHAGDSLFALVGPLGHATDIKRYGSVSIVGGGVGIAEIYPVARALKEAGNIVTVILGARTDKLLILRSELAAIADRLEIATDDGSTGHKGFTTDILKGCLAEGSYDLVYAVGPIPMMKQVALVTKPHSIKTLVSLNALMIDGTGMCGCCRITVNGKTKFACIDGPEFDAHAVDWQLLEKRTMVYTNQEKHICKLADTLTRPQNDAE